MVQKTLERVVVLQSEPTPILGIQSASALQDGSIVFTDKDSKQLKMLQSGHEESNIFVTDGQIGTKKLVLNLEGTIAFLQNLGNLYRAFSVHYKHQKHKICALKETLQMVKAVSSSYCNGTIEDVKESSDIRSATNGPQGTIAVKIVSISWKRV